MYCPYALFRSSQGYSGLLVGVEKTPITSWEDTPKIQLGVHCRKPRQFEIPPPGSDLNHCNSAVQLPTSPGRLPRCKDSQSGCSASSAKSSRRCQWGLPGGGGQALSSRIYFMSPAQTAQLTRDGMAAANKLSASFNPLHLQRGARQLGGQPGASSPWSDKHNCARNRSLIAGG